MGQTWVPTHVVSRSAGQAQEGRGHTGGKVLLGSGRRWSAEGEGQRREVLPWEYRDPSAAAPDLGGTAWGLAGQHPASAHPHT